MACAAAGLQVTIAQTKAHVGVGTGIILVFHMETPRADKMPRGEKATKQLLPARRPADSLPNGHCRKL